MKSNKKADDLVNKQSKQLLDDYIKQKNRDLFHTYHIQAKQFPTSFAIKNQSLKVFCYFLLLKYAPKVLILREKLRQYFLH